MTAPRAFRYPHGGRRRRPHPPHRHRLLPLLAAAALPFLGITPPRAPGGSSSNGGGGSKSVHLVISAAAQSTILPTPSPAGKPPQFMSCWIHDFPADTPNPDFDRGSNGCRGSGGPTLGSTGAVVAGMVQRELGVDGNPVAAKTPSEIASAASFSEWWEPSGHSKRIRYELPLNDDGAGNWGFSEAAFYPISGRGYDDGKIERGEWWGRAIFSMRCETEFVYKGAGETISFRADDDVWVFAGGQLLGDAGGIHDFPGAGPENTDVPVGTLDLKPGCRYFLKIFFANRCIEGSALVFSTTLEPVLFNEAGGSVCADSDRGQCQGDDCNVYVYKEDRAPTPSEEEAAILARNAAQLTTIGAVLGGIFGFFALYFLILGVVWYCKRDTLAEQRLHAQMRDRGKKGGDLEMAARRKKDSSKKRKKNKSGKKRGSREELVGGAGGSSSSAHRRQQTFAGWNKVFDDATQLYYYSNEMTGETRWAEDLAKSKGFEVVSPLAASKHKRTFTQAEKELAMAGWQEHWDDATGIPFYYNTFTHETVWEKPLA
jgi:fibro-slime domain-containing protein